MVKPTVILVHIGDDFIEYLNDCIRQIQLFNNCEIILATSEQHFSHIVHNVELLALEKLNKSKNHIDFLTFSKRNVKFRGGFWNSVVERFYIIEDVMIYKNLKHVFHFENDVMLYCNLQEILKTIVNNKIMMAAPFDNDQRCIPSFVYFNGTDVLGKLNIFMAMHNDFNDMELIAMFNNKYNLILQLPVIPPSYNKSLKSKSGLTVQNPHKYYEHFDKFNSLFDAAALGQYLGGIDSRNWKINIFAKIFKGKIHFINESAVYNASEFNIFWELDEFGRKVPFVDYKNDKIRINNLHIHSKKLKLFS
jgi:hypothetical protein